MSHLAKSLVITFQTYPAGSHLGVKRTGNEAISGLGGHVLPLAHPRDLPSAGHKEQTQQNTASGLFRAQHCLLHCTLARFSTEAHCAFSPLIIFMILSDCNVKYRFFDAVSTNVYRVIPASGEMGRGSRGGSGLQGVNT